MPRSGGTCVPPRRRPSIECRWDKTLVKRDELQPGWLTNSVPACLRYPYPEYYFNTHLAHPSTSRGEGIMVSKILAVLIVLTTAASLPSAAKMRGPSTPEERARAIDYVRSLEENPLAKDGLEKRMWLTEWIVEVPDVTVNACCKERSEEHT